MTPLVVDMHFGILNGVGWGNGEVAGQNPSTTTTFPANKWSLTLTVVSAAQFKIDQLICFVGTDGDYYSAVIKSISGNTLTLKAEVGASVATGAPVYGFYDNDAHANINGYRTIADSSLRMLTHHEEHISTLPASSWIPYNGGTVSADTTFTYNNPGCSRSGYMGALVSCPDVNTGAMSIDISLKAGIYSMYLPLNIGQRAGGYSGGVTVDVQLTAPSGQKYGIATQTVTGYDGIKLVKATFATMPGAIVRVIAKNANGGSAYFSVGQLRYCRITDKIASLNQGKHVLFGDSWVANGFLLDRLQTKLPAANLVNKGIPGNYITNLVSRFWTDVAPENPDYVWVMCGTNDYYNGTTAEQFSVELNTIKRNLMQIGAQPIFWTCSVGSAFYPVAPWEQLTNSRTYAMGITYHDQPT